MKPVEVVEARRWRNKVNGATASVFGAVPWTREADKPNWEMESVGYTLRLSSGTTGIGRAPFKTREEAEKFMANWLFDIAEREKAANDAYAKEMMASVERSERGYARVQGARNRR